MRFSRRFVRVKLQVCCIQISITTFSSENLRFDKTGTAKQSSPRKGTMGDNSTEIINSQQDTSFFYKLFLMRTVIYIILICIAIYGLASNTINILVFLKMKLKDNVNLTFLFLSISDLMFLLTNCLLLVLKVVDFYHPELKTPPNDHLILVLLRMVSGVFQGYSALVSVFMAVVRCLCVARPLKFKSMFTKSRTLTTLGVLLLAAIVQMYADMATIKVGWAVDPRTNSTYLAARYGANFPRFAKLHDIINKNILIWLVYIIVVTCTIILAYKLQVASKFRRSAASQAKPVGKTSGPSKSFDSSSHPESAERNEKSAEKMSTKERQVVKSVILICIIYILSILPLQVQSLVRVLFPVLYN
ncbi:chemosensory receptor A, partial [Elysia marginata]